MKKWLWGLLIMSVAIGVGLYVQPWKFTASSVTANTVKRADKNRPAQTVIVLPAYTMPLQDRVEAVGNAMANESVDITPQTNGTITEIHFKEGQTVKRGDRLVVFRQQQEQAELAGAQAQVKVNQSELTRLQNLLQHQAASQREVDDRIATLESAKQMQRQIQARLDDLTLRAPFNGVIGLRYFSVGAQVNPGQVITHLDDIEQIKVHFTLPSAQLPTIKPGTIFSASSGELGMTLFDGKVTAIDTRIDSSSGSFSVRGLIDNPKRQLKPGLLLRITVQQPPRQAMIVAEESVIQRQQTHFVFVVGDDNRVVQKNLHIGTRQPGLVEVLDGLALGDRVIVRGMGTVKAGDAVSIQQEIQKLSELSSLLENPAPGSGKSNPSKAIPSKSMPSHPTPNPVRDPADPTKS
jgi:membrane fusion protein (multidrug efflux system)